MTDLGSPRSHCCSHTLYTVVKFEFKMPCHINWDAPA